MWKTALVVALFCAVGAVCCSAQEAESESAGGYGGDPLEAALNSIDSAIASLESIQRDNANLKAGLQNVSELLITQGQLLNEQTANYQEQLKISRTQSDLLKRELKKGKILKWTLIASAPVCLICGGIIGWRITR